MNEETAERRAAREIIADHPDVTDANFDKMCDYYAAIITRTVSEPLRECLQMALADIDTLLSLDGNFVDKQVIEAIQEQKAKAEQLLGGH